MQLKEDKIEKTHFQRDGATAHTANISVTLLDDEFADRIISKTIWSPSSPDLSPPEIFLWDAMTNSVYSNNPHTVGELKTAVTEYIRNVVRAVLNTVFENTVRRVNKCLETGGRHFKH